MSLDSGSSRPRGPLAWSIKVTLVLGLAATALAHHAAKPTDPHRRSARLPGDPEVTGSIGPRAQATRLDPCALGAPLRAGVR
ncbi:MAG: hypothetical protein PGN25_22855 [Methylorubrum populi]